uniref:Transmembrane protein n=1 Tax=Steinernema glaseri TaxID=37863 RepID=A0A1I7YPC6_9BILA
MLLQPQPLHGSFWTGVRVIAGMLSLTVCLELWHLCLTLYWLPVEGSGGSVLAATFQLLVGVAIAGSVIYALCKEQAAFLLPYLVLQTVGLAAGAVFLVTFIYISLFGDGDTVVDFIEDQGRHMVDDPPPVSTVGSIGASSVDSAVFQSESKDFTNWMLVGTFTVILAVQIWLISIVFACWRYFRDKRAFGCPNGYMSYVVIRPPFDAAMRAGIPSSISADMVTLAFRPCGQRFKRHTGRSMSSSIVE